MLSLMPLKLLVLDVSFLLDTQQLTAVFQAIFKLLKLNFLCLKVESFYLQVYISASSIKKICTLWEPWAHILADQ
jgi:energy-converting hydrogenase Eha subunit C